MSSNKKDNNGWILCPSKSFPGKFYYFNVQNGEAAWSLNDADQKTLRKDNDLQKADKSHSYPEPSSPPAESPTTSLGPIHRTVSNTTKWTLPNIQPTFGQAMFPSYISNVDPYMQNIIWMPIQLPMFVKPRQDQVTQTWEPEREIFVQASCMPLSKRFNNYEDPNMNIFSRSHNKNDQSSCMNNSHDSPVDKTMTTSQIFGQTLLSRQNKNDLPICKMTNIFLNNESNKIMTNTQLFKPNARLQNDSIKKNTRQRTQSESDKKIEEMLYDNQNHGVNTSTQMLEQAKNSKSTKDTLITTVRRQTMQSDSDNIFFEKPYHCDNSKSILTNSNKGYNAIQQNIVSLKTENQTKNPFALKKSVLSPMNKVHSTRSQMDNTGQVEKEVKKDFQWHKQDINFLEANKKDSSVNQEKNNKNDNEKGNLLDKLDKNDLRYTLEIKRRKSVDLGIIPQQEGNKVKTHHLNSTQKETPKKRVTFDLDSETSVELQDCNDNQTQYVNIHTLRRLTDEIAEYWYIVVDCSILLEDFEFIDKFVQLDNQCILLIPHAVQSAIESFCFGDCRGQQRVIVARQLMRKLATPPPHIVVQPLENEDEVFTTMSTLGRILNCCLQMIEQDNHVVLITDDSILYDKAITLKIHCYKLNEIKDGASKPEVLKPEPIKNSLKNDAAKNLFLQKDFVPTWKTPIDTTKQIFSKQNTLENSNVQTDMPPTTNANTSPIIFEETIDKNHGTSNEYLNFDYDSNSDTTHISNTMRKLYIRDNNSNYVVKKSTPTSKSILDDEKHSFTFQIKNKNTLQEQNVTSNQSKNLKDQNSNQLHNSKEKSNNLQKPIKESIFSVLNDPLKNVQFQIQNKPMKREIRLENKNVEFQIQRTEKEIQNIPNSNNTNRRLMQEKLKASIQENLKNRFQVSSNLMEENLRTNIEEWICTFVQVMENALAGLLQESNLSSLSLPPPWTLHEAITCVKQVYKELWAVCVVADELSLLLLNNSNEQGQLTRTINPEKFMRVFGCGVLLIEYLQATEQMPECIREAQELLNDMLLTLQSGKEDIDLIRTPAWTRNDDEEEMPKRHNFMKKPSEVLQYLKKHFTAWQSHEESPVTPTAANDKVVTNKNDTKIVRTCGRNLNLLTIDKTKSMTMNAKKNPTIDNQNEKRSQSIDIKENSEISISPNTLLSSEKTVKLIENNEEQKVVRLIDVATPIAKKNEDDSANIIKQNENKESFSDNTVSTQKLYEEPKILRIFDASTPFPTKKLSKDTKNDLIFLSPKHGNTFGSQEDTAGPKVVRNIKPIDAFEEKLKFRVDMDELDYSMMEETLSTVSNTSQFTVIDGNDSNNDKISLNDQNNNTDDQKDGSNVSPFANSIKNLKDCTDNQNYDESNISMNDSFNEDRSNETVQNNDSLKPNDSSTNDSGFVNENYTYTLVQTFLSELSGSMKLIYKFIEDSMKEFRNKDLQSEKRKKILDKATTTHGHLTGIIHKLQCIVQREADAVTPLKEVILKADVVVVSDKRMMRYRQVVMKCLEQAQMLDGALRLLLAIADGDYDVTFCSDRSVYFNIFE